MEFLRGAGEFDFGDVGMLWGVDVGIRLSLIVKFTYDSERPLRAWFADTKYAVWKTPTVIKQQYRNASIVANNRVVFNIKGNDYRYLIHLQVIF
jgi:mRNA-degrading endonuclease HigB of HigAB toxin-antitoxin module